MANYLRPKRGKRSSAIEQDLLLLKGEIFFECPESGMGTGPGKIKIGDGFSTYADLPYFLEGSSSGTRSISSGANTTITYSTDEQVVGEWLNGYPIIQKTFTNVRLTRVENTYEYIAVIVNASEGKDISLIDSKVIFENTDTNSRLISPSVYKINSSSITCNLKQDSTGEIRYIVTVDDINSIIDIEHINLIVTIQYINRITE